MVESAAWWGHEGPVLVSAGTDGGRAVLRVSRAGTDLTPREAEELFAPRRAGSGAGSKLGLYVARATAEAQGGSLRAEVSGGIRFLLEGKASGGSVAVFEFDVPAGARVPIAHSHDAYEETIYGLSGVLTWTVNGQKHEIGPGQVLCIPRGAIHRFDNTRGADATMLAIVTPGILGPGYFRDVAATIAAAAGGPPNPAAIAEVMRRHGLTPAP